MMILYIRIIIYVCLHLVLVQSRFKLKYILKVLFIITIYVESQFLFNLPVYRNFKMNIFCTKINYFYTMQVYR
jgi:hypothetical protein